MFVTQWILYLFDRQYGKQMVLYEDRLFFPNVNRAVRVHIFPSMKLNLTYHSV